MVESSDAVQEKIRKLQLLEQELSHLSVQKQQLSIQLKEINDALSDLGESEKSYKIIGNVVVSADGDELIKELNSKKESVSLRISSIEKQECVIKDRFSEAQKEVVSDVGKDLISFFVFIIFIMPDYVERIKELEKELSETSYNKRTQHHIGLLKAKIADLKQKQATRSSSKNGSSVGFSVRRSGDGTVVLIGLPSVGKSTLLNRVTDASSKAGAYAFTTLTCIPGILNFRGSKIQILDVPGIVKGASRGSGRGKEVISVVRSADLVLLVADVLNLGRFKILEKELWDSDIALDHCVPDVRITRTSKGGVVVSSTVKLSKIDESTVADILRELKIINASVVIREDIDYDQLIDVIKGNRKYVSSVRVINKIDVADVGVLEKANSLFPDAVFVSGESGVGVSKLKRKIYSSFGFFRVFLKERGKDADFDEPMILSKGSSVRDLCERIHKDFVGKFKFAKVSGRSSKFAGQKLGLSHKLMDRDVVEIFLE